MARKIVWEITDDVLIVRRSKYGRFSAGLYAAAKTFPLALGAAAVFFSPDYFFGRITADEPVPGLFWLSLVLIALFASFLWALFQFLRRDRWIFDGEGRILVAEVKTLFGGPATGEAELRELEALLLQSRGGPRKSALRLRLASGEEEVLFSGHGLGEELTELSEVITNYLREYRFQVSVERGETK